MEPRAELLSTTLKASHFLSEAEQIEDIDTGVTALFICLVNK
jgi:hypothetical protein